jgi:hypothetical protein
MTVDRLGPNGESLGTDTVDVCGDPFHIYVYVVGQVSLTPDTSATDSDARGTAEILEGFNRNCDAVDPVTDRKVGDILRRIYGTTIKPITNLTNNSIAHAPVAGDELFDPLESTFHHYDVRTQVCDSGDPSCTVDVIDAEVLRRFTYPSFQLQPTFTAIDNVETRLAYITLPFLTDASGSYVLPAGPIKQRRLVDPGFLQGGSQNITQSSHLVFPGLITRKARLNSRGVEVFTHGLGLNRAFCTPRGQLTILNGIIAYSNDRLGPKAFRQLDREMIKYYRRRFLSGSIPTQPNVGVNLPLGTRALPGALVAP